MKRSQPDGHAATAWSLPLRRLVTGAPPDASRVFFTSVWFEGHNNPRYAELLPRLGRLDRYLVTLPAQRVRRGVLFRAYRATRPLHYRLAGRLAAGRYRSMFTADNEQIPCFPGRIVSDVDDPFFTRREVELLNRPNVAAYVVTAEHAARRYEALGVDKPWHVIPQGVSLSSVTPAAVVGAGARKRPGEVVVGFTAAFLLTGADRDGGNPLYNVDHLLELWDEIHARAAGARLWLIGQPSERLRTRCAGRDDIVLFGLLPRAEALAHTATFDVALYARTRDTGIRAAKTAEYLGLGVPVVSYDYEVTRDVREAGAGILVDAPRAFVDAVVTLVRDEGRRRALADAARRAGARLDWDALAARYEREVLDRHLRP